MVIEKLKSHEVFQYFRPEQINALSDQAKVVTFKRGETIYLRGEKAHWLYVVLKGRVELRLPGKEGFSVLIDQLEPGAMFGSCISFAMDTYALNALCSQDCELVKLHTSALKGLMDEDLRMGYAVQSRISEIYFMRYIETMKKLQAIVMSMPVEPD